MKITVDEILDALAAEVRERGRGAQDARTTKELAKAHGLTERAVIDALYQLKSAGRLKTHQVPRETLDGRIRRIPAYTILPARKGAK